MSKDQLQRDKRLIDGGLTDAKSYIAEKKYDECKKILSRITPTSKRIEYRIYETAFLTCTMNMKMENYPEARKSAEECCRLKPDDALPWKLLIQIEIESKSSRLLDTIVRALETCQPDASLLKQIAPFLIELDDENLTKQFIRLLDVVPNALELPITAMIPEYPYTLEIRLKMLELQAMKDNEVCSRLINTLIEESDIFQAPRWIKHLPVDNQDRIYVETLFGDEPLKSAEKHIANGSELFSGFVKAAKKRDLKALRNAISVIPPFVSGWMYYINLLTDPNARLQAINDALFKYPNYIPLIIKLSETKEELGDVQSAIATINQIIKNDPYTGTPLLIRILIRQGRGQEAEKLLDEDVNNVITQEERVQIDLLMYRQDKNKERLRRILKSENTAKTLTAKAEAAYELREELKDDAEKYFVDAMKANKDDPFAYLFFGKYMMDYKKDERKAIFLFQRAYDLGLEDKSALELTSRSLAEQGKLEESLSLAQKVDTDWSHFRSGLILQKLGRHEEACEEFQKDLRFNPNRLTSWSALGHSYLVLGRAKAAMSVLQEIHNIGGEDIDLDLQLKALFECPIPFETDFNMEKSPQRFFAYLQQTISKLRMFQRFNRNETCLFLSERILPLVNEFASKWNNLGSVMKICGDYYIEHSNIVKDQNYLTEAQKCYMKRAEIDRRAEAFIDVAKVLALRDLPDQAALVLRRAVKTFTDHSGVWMYLGVTFALLKQFAYARHCLCVAAKLATSTEMARSYSCIAAIALLIEDDKLLETAINAARSFNPYDPDVWQILIQTKKVDKLEASKVAFEFGASQNILPNLPLFALKCNKPVDALHFSFMGEDSTAISASFEALKKYDFALMFADEKDAKRIERLKRLQKEEKFSKVEVESTEEPLKSLAEAAGKIQSGDRKGATEKNLDVLKNFSNSSFSSDLERAILQVSPKGTKLDLPHSETDPIEFLYNAKRTMNSYDAAKTSFEKFGRSAPIIKNLCMEILRDRREEDYQFAYTSLQEAMKYTNDREMLRLQAVLQMKLGMKKEAKISLQQLAILSPHLYKKLKQSIQQLSE